MEFISSYKVVTAFKIIYIDLGFLLFPFWESEDDIIDIKEDEDTVFNQNIWLVKYNFEAVLGEGINKFSLL